MRATRTSTRSGGGGIEFTYTKGEERRFERRRVIRELLPLLAEAAADLEEQQLAPAEASEDASADGGKKKMRRASVQPPPDRTRSVKLRSLAQRLRAVSGAQ